MFDLKGLKALVTGAGGMIGASVAESLYSVGAEVYITDISEEILANFSSKFDNKIKYIGCNLLDKSSSDLLQEFCGEIDILVNNAGITKDGLAMRMRDEDFEKVISVNLFSSFRLCRTFVKGMIKKRFGRIINVASVVGFTGNPGQANYCASKAGLVGMSKSLAYEVASRGVTVNCVAPGFIATNMTAGLGEDREKQIMGSIPIGRMGEPFDVANSIIFLASREASYITGATIHVNGGMAML